MSSRKQYKDYITELKKHNKELSVSNDELKKFNLGLINSLNESRRRSSRQSEEITKLSRQLKASKKWYQIVLR